MTDCIQQIVYGEHPEEIQINPYLRIIKQPVEILREFAIVDTPGTNTIVDHHQEITERFIPASDLIVFVFEAKTHTVSQVGSSYPLFRMNGGRKSCLFCNKRSANRRRIASQYRWRKTTCHQARLVDPLVFAVSARDEIAGQKPRAVLSTFEITFNKLSLEVKHLF